MRRHHSIRWAIRVILLLWIIVGSLAWGENEPLKKPSVFEGIGNTAEQVGKKIKQGFTKAATKLREKQIRTKVERKLKKAGTKTAEGFEKARRKMDQKLNR